MAGNFLAEVLAGFFGLFMRVTAVLMIVSFGRISVTLDNAL